MTKTEYIISILPVLYFIIVGVLYWRMSNKVSLMLNDLKELHEEGKAADEYLDSLANRLCDLEDRVEEDRVFEEVLEAVGGKQVPPSRN